MVVLLILYPAGIPLDFDYYRDEHLPLVRRLYEPEGLRSLTYYRPVAPSTYQLVAELRFDTMAQLLAARAKHSATSLADIAKFTTTMPTTLVGEELVA